MNDTIDGIFEPFDSYVKDQLELRKTILSNEKARKGGVEDESVATVDYDTEVADTEYEYDILINDKNIIDPIEVALALKLDQKNFIKKVFTSKVVDLANENHVKFG